MKPLSPLLFLKGNLKSALPIFVSVAVGVFLVYFYALFGATSIKMINVASFDLVEKYNITYTDDNKPLPASFLRKIKEADGGGIIPVRLDSSSGLPYFRGGPGNVEMLNFNIFDDDAARLLKNYGVKLQEGRLPRDNQNEILVPREYALHAHVGVGDYIGTEVSDAYGLLGKYKICGLTEGPVFFTVECQPGKETKEQLMERGVLYPIDKLGAAAQRSLFDDMPFDVVYKSYDSFKQSFAIVQTAYRSLTYFLTGMIVTVLCVALVNISAIVFANRVDEFAILHAVGYAKGNLSRKLWEENAFVCCAGYLAGIGFAELAAWLLNNAVFYSQGEELSMVSLSGMISAFAMPVFVSVFSLLPCLSHNFSRHEEINI